MKKIISAITLAILALPSISIHGQDNIAAITPPMGWNSYNCFGAAVREDEVRANAGILSKIKSFGWEYVVVDYCWFYPHHPMSNQENPPQFRLPKDGSYVPWLPMDNYGRLFPDPGKFPSASEGSGFRTLADYIHSLGLKFGIHVMRGIPRQAVWEKSPVKDAPGIDASMIADTLSKCTWLNTMYGLDMSKSGSQEYLNSLLELYASWGVDFIKVDDISSPYHAAEIEGYRKAISGCGRKIILSLSPGATPLSMADHVSKYADLWRLSPDFWDNWDQLKEAFALAESWTPYRSEGRWPDLDMLQLGRLSRRGPVGPERDSRFTRDEQLTHMTLWCIARSPLFIGGDLTMADSITMSLFTNSEVTGIARHSERNRQIRNSGDIIVWTASGPEERQLYLAVFNTGNNQANAVVSWKELGIRGKMMVRDLWQSRDIGYQTAEIKCSIPTHGCRLFSLRQN